VKAAQSVIRSGAARGAASGGVAVRRARTPYPRAGARAWLALLCFLGVLLGSAPAALAQAPLFTFAQISDSQPDDEADWAAFQRVLDAIVASGSAGALIPQPIDFVLFAGDLVSHARQQSEWIRFVDTIDASLTANAIPYRAVPGNHDDQEPGFDFYEFYIGDSGVWDTDSASVVGQNGPSVYTGWKGLRIIGFNNSNGGWNQISAADLAAIDSKVTAAAAAGENPFLMGHHPHDDRGVIPLASVLENTVVCCYAHGHSGSPSAKLGLPGIVNPYIWRMDTNSIYEEQAILYYEAYATELRVYVIELYTNPTALPAPETIPLAYALQPVVLNPPVAEFTGTPIAGVTPLTVSFRDASTGYPSAWLWTFGDGATSTEQHPSHSYTTAGVYDVSLTASNAAGSNTKLRTGYVSVSPPPPAQTFLPTADAYVKSSSPNSNYGSSSELRVKTGDSIYRSYLRFDLGSLTGPWVISAKLRLYTTDGSSDGGALYPVAGGWTESGITWATAPAVGGAPIAAGAAVTAGQWREIDVTSWVRGTGTYEFALQSGSSNSAYYSSRQGANPPQLVVQSLAAAIPVADFAGTPTSGPAPLAVQFTDLSSGGPSSWLWTFGDGTTSTLRNPSKTYTSPGVYDVTLRASNSLGSSTTTRSGYVQVVIPPPPVADFSGTPLSGFAPLQVAFTDLSANGPTSWLWSFGDGTTSTLQSPSKTYAAPGVYSVSLQVTNLAGSDTRVRAGYVNVASGKIFTAAADARTSSGSPTRNYGGSSELRAGSSSTVYNSYLRFDLAGLSDSAVVSARLRLFVTGSSDSGGSVYAVSSAWTESGITWNNAPVPSGGPLASAGPASTGQWVEFDVTGAVTGDGSVSFALTNASADRVDYSSREGTSPPQLWVWTGPPVAPVADFGATPREGPAPLAVAFTDLSTGGPTSWLWDFGDGSTSTLRSPVHQYTSEGSRDVRLTVTNSAGTNTLLRPGYVLISAPLAITSFQAVADAKTSSANPSVNYGSAPDLRVRGGTSSWRSFLRFDVAGLAKPVVRAKLRLYVDDPSDEGGAVSAVSSSWSEGAITWSTAPPLGATLASLGAVAAGTWVEFDVTPAVTGNGTYAFGLGKSSSDSAYYGSRESAHPPELVIETSP
jgi:PKD repeat protein